MPIDTAARTAQVARIFGHAGDAFTWQADDASPVVPFSAAVSSWTPAATDADRNVGDDTSVLVSVPRSVFTGKQPRQGQAFKDADGRIYRIQGARSIPPTHPTLQFICGSVAFPA